MRSQKGETMSAYVVGRDHVWYLVEALGQLVHSEAAFDKQAEWGQTLWDENVRSVQYRYPDCPLAELPGPIDCTYQYGAHEIRRIPSVTADPVAVLKACDGYEYQACETDDWADTPAHGLIERLRVLAIHALPGYEDAAWEVRS